MSTAVQPTQSDLTPSDDVTILLVGITQTGKSTLINRLASMLSSNPPVVAPVGTGGLSHTKECQLYQIKVTPAIFNLSYAKKSPQGASEDDDASDTSSATTDSSVEEVANPADVQRVIEAFLSNELLIKREEGKETTYNLNILDTPGLDDSDSARRANVDDEHMLSILQTLRRHNKINAVWFLANSQGSLSGSFQQHYRYYRSVLPDLTDKFVIIHTRCSMDLLNYQPDFQRVRMQEFGSIDKSNVKHFFVNSIWKDKPYGPLETAYNNASIGSLLNLTSSMPIHEISTLSFLKSENIKRVESSIIAYAQGKISGFIAQLALVSNEDSYLGKSIAKLTSEISSRKIKRTDAQQQLTLKDNKNHHLIDTATINQSWKFFKPSRSSVLMVTGGYRIVHVDKNPNNSKCTFEEPIYSNNLCTVSVTINTVFWGGLYGTITAYTTNDIRFETEIRQLKETVKETTAEIDMKTDELSDLTSRSDEKKKQKEQYEGYVNSCNYITERFGHKMILFDEYEKVRDIYDRELQFLKDGASLDKDRQKEVTNSILVLLGCSKIE